MKKQLFLLGICIVSINGYSQNFALKSNLLYDATTTFNLGVEFALADRWTLDISGNYNPWAFSQYEKNASTGETAKTHDAKLKHFMIQPELRWWPCEKFYGHFFGVHAHYGIFNIGGLTFLPDGWGDGWTGKDGTQHKEGVQNKRFEGWLTGTGISYGYHWILNDYFSMEFTLGAGYAYLSYDKYPCSNCSPKEESSYMHYLGPTKIGISAIFILK
jgi:long-subunit fatty acid transport protein